MAGTHENITFGTSEVKEVLKSRIIKGKILVLKTGKANISTDDYGTLENIPIFYHCEGSGNTASGWTAFAAGDDVTVIAINAVNTTITPDMKIIGFWQQPPRSCVPVIYVSLTYTFPDIGQGSAFFVFDPKTNMYVTIPGLTFPAEETTANRAIFNQWVADGHPYVPSDEIFDPVEFTPDAPLLTDEGSGGSLTASSNYPNKFVTVDSTDQSNEIGSRAGTGSAGGPCFTIDVPCGADNTEDQSLFTQTVNVPHAFGQVMVVKKGPAAGFYTLAGASGVWERQCSDKMTWRLGLGDTGTVCDWDNATAVSMAVSSYSDQIDITYTFTCPLGHFDKTFSYKVTGDSDCQVFAPFSEDGKTVQFNDIPVTIEISGCLIATKFKLGSVGTVDPESDTCSQLLGGTWIDLAQYPDGRYNGRAVALFPQINENTFTSMVSKSITKGPLAVQVYIMRPLTYNGDTDIVAGRWDHLRHVGTFPDYYRLAQSSRRQDTLVYDEFKVDETVVYCSSDIESEDIYNPLATSRNSVFEDAVKATFEKVRTLAGATPTDVANGLLDVQFYS